MSLDSTPRSQNLTMLCARPFTPLLLQPRLATSRSAFLTFTLSNARLIGLHPTAPRLATYCSSLHTGASFCLLHTSRQHWGPTSLRALPTSPLPQGSKMPCLLGPSPPACTLLLLGLQPPNLLSLLGLRFASYIPLGSTGFQPVCGPCPLLSLPGAPTCPASLGLYFDGAPFHSSF